MLNYFWCENQLIFHCISVSFTTRYSEIYTKICVIVKMYLRRWCWNCVPACLNNYVVTFSKQGGKLSSFQMTWLDCFLELERVGGLIYETDNVVACDLTLMSTIITESVAVYGHSSNKCLSRTRINTFALLYLPLD